MDWSSPHHPFVSSSWEPSYAEHTPTLPLAAEHIPVPATTTSEEEELLADEETDEEDYVNCKSDKAKDNSHFASAITPPPSAAMLQHLQQPVQTYELVDHFPQDAQACMAFPTRDGDKQPENPEIFPPMSLHTTRRMTTLSNSISVQTLQDGGNRRRQTLEETQSLGLPCLNMNDWY